MEPTGTNAQGVDDRVEGAIPNDDAGSSPPPSSDGTTPSPNDARLKELRDRLAEAGRERIARDQQIAALNNQITTLSSQMGSVITTLGAEQRRQQEAYLASLPPSQRQEEQIRLLQAQVARLTAPPPQRQPSQQEMVEYARARSQQIVTEANILAGLDDDEVVTLDDIPQDAWIDEATFAREVGRIARERARGQQQTRTAGGADEMAGKTKTTNGTITLTDAQLQERLKVATDAAVKAALSGAGVSSPTAPRPAGATGDAGAPDFETIFARGRTNFQGTGAIRKQLEEARSRLNGGK